MPSWCWPVVETQHVMMEDLEHRGWTVVEGIVASDSLVQLARTLGTPVAPYDRPLVQRLLAMDSSQAPANSYSFRHGRHPFPFHTDLANWTTPPRYVLLRSPLGTCAAPTLLTDADSLPADFLPSLRAASFTARAWTRSFACNILSRYRGFPLFRWDQHAMTPLDSFAKTAADTLVHHLRHLRPSATVTVPWASSDRVLVIDNWRMLHARPDVTAEPQRTLERVFVTTGDN